MNNYKAFNIHERGYSHLTSGLPRQDNSYSVSCDEYAIAVIADGHGSPQYFRSDRGSAFAVEVCSNLLINLITRKKDARKNASNLKSFIKRDWDKMIQRDFDSDPFTQTELDYLASKINSEDEPKRKSKMIQYFDSFQSGTKVQKAYGSTLIAVASCDDYMVGVHIGDGTCVAFYEDGTYDQPIPSDQNNMANTTGSLCNDNPGCRVYFFDKKPLAVFVASDGLDDSFGQGEQLYNFYRQVCINFAVHGEEYVDILQSKLAEISKRGSKDDMSIAGIYNLEALSTFEPIMKKMLSCGQLKHQFYSLQETNGGVSEYSLKAKETKYKKAKDAYSKCEKEKSTIFEKLRTIKAKVFGLKAEFNYDDPDAVDERINRLRIQEQQCKMRATEVAKKIHDLRLQITQLEAEEADNAIKLQQVKLEYDSFMEGYECYRSSHSDEQFFTEKSRTIEEQCSSAAEEEKMREIEYLDALTSYNNAQDRKKELFEQISALESEIKRDVEAMQSVFSETIKNQQDQSSLSSDVATRQAMTFISTTDAEINEAIAMLDKNAKKLTTD